MLKNVSLCGVGGQGVLVVSRLIAEAALHAGFDVRRSEVHGMSQRGGSVISQVRYGDRVHSPLIPDGASDILIALELLEAARYLHALRTDGVLLVNDLCIRPVRMGPGDHPYPDNLRELCENSVERAIILPASDIAVELGETRAANTVMLGAYSLFAPEIDPEAWSECLRIAFRPEHRAVNLEAFETGRSLAEEAIPALSDIR